MAARLDARRILDLGCGTGLLTVTFAAAAGRTVVGVDPSESMLAVARSRPGAEGVRWISGDSRDIPAEPFDLAVMTGNVAQHIDDADWSRTHSDARRALRVGGTLAFESRNPAVRAWDSWASEPASERETPHGRLREWLDVTEHGRGRTTLHCHNVFVASGEHVVEEIPLAFRSRDEVVENLAAHGFEVEAVFGDWAERPFRDCDPLMVFSARAV